jgi:hypothetical protein
MGIILNLENVYRIISAIPNIGMLKMRNVRKSKLKDIRLYIYSIYVYYIYIYIYVIHINTMGHGGK